MQYRLRFDVAVGAAEEAANLSTQRDGPDPYQQGRAADEAWLTVGEGGQRLLAEMDMQHDLQQTTPTSTPAGWMIKPRPGNYAVSTAADSVAGAVD